MHCYRAFAHSIRDVTQGQRRSPSHTTSPTDPGGAALTRRTLHPAVYTGSRSHDLAAPACLPLSLARLAFSVARLRHQVRGRAHAFRGASWERGDCGSFSSCQRRHWSMRTCSHILTVCEADATVLFAATCSPSAESGFVSHACATPAT